MNTTTADATESNKGIHHRLPPLTARQWSDTATNYRDHAALFCDLLDFREAARHGHYAARYSARAFEAWLGSHDGAAR